MKRTKLLDLEKASRRQMLATGIGGCAALTNTSLLSTMFSLSATNSAVAQSGGSLGGYKAMVCLFQYGGNDSYNMLSPVGTAERAAYETVRGGVYTGPGSGALALPSNANMNVTDSASGRSFMVHPAMPGVRDLYNDGKLAFVCNVGSLIEPTSMSDFQSQAALPLGLFSHADLQQHWMTSVPQSRSQVTGWAGRMADMIAASPQSVMNQSVSMNMSLGSVNMMQTGGSVVPYVITESGAQEVGWYGPTWTQAKMFTTMTDDYLSQSYSNLLEKTFANQNQVALDAAQEFNAAANQSAVTSLVDQHFPNNGGSRLGRELRSVARAIAASGAINLGTNPTIGQSRQMFFVSHNNYDHHDELIVNQQNRLYEVGMALANFQAAMDALGLSDEVVLFTASDFARTLSSNGKGSDHAWGGVSMVMGGGVQGGRLHGQYPTSLTNPQGTVGRAGQSNRETTSLDLGRGRLLPTLSVDEMVCELASWYGVSNDNNMEMILPNIRNFVDAGVARPVGFLA